MTAYIDVNLDGLDETELGEFIAACDLLSRYASHKQIAMRMRKAGKTVDAVKMESECERIYQQLPDWAKW
jgi:anti-sigma factor RsiW